MPTKKHRSEPKAKTSGQVVSRSLDRVVGLLGDILDNAQTIRIVQVQSRIAKRHKEKADAAWQHLNAAHKAVTELIQPNQKVHLREHSERKVEPVVGIS